MSCVQCTLETEFLYTMGKKHIKIESLYIIRVILCFNSEYFYVKCLLRQCHPSPILPPYTHSKCNLHSADSLAPFQWVWCTRSPDNPSSKPCNFLQFTFFQRLCRSICNFQQPPPPQLIKVIYSYSSYLMVISSICNLMTYHAAITSGSLKIERSRWYWWGTLMSQYKTSSW